MPLIKKISVEGAVDVICRVAELPSFRTTPESQKAMDDLVLACEVRSRLIETEPDVEVRADDGRVFINMDAPVSRRQSLAREIKTIAQTVPGVREVRVETFPASPYTSEDY